MYYQFLFKSYNVIRIYIIHLNKGIILNWSIIWICSFFIVISWVLKVFLFRESLIFRCFSKIFLYFSHIFSFLFFFFLRGRWGFFLVFSKIFFLRFFYTFLEIFLCFGCWWRHSQCRLRGDTWEHEHHS